MTKVQMQKVAKGTRLQEVYVEARRVPGHNGAFATVPKRC